MHTVSYHLCIYTFAYNVFLNEGINYKINKMVTNGGKNRLEGTSIAARLLNIPYFDCNRVNILHNYKTKLN